MGDGDFLEAVLKTAQEGLERKYALAGGGVTLEQVAERVAQLLNLKLSEIWAPGKERRRVRARSLLCYWAAREAGISMADLSRRFNLSPAAVSLSVQRGEKIARDNNYSLMES